MSSLRRACAALVLAPALQPAAADAGTLRTSAEVMEHIVQAVTYRASPGERNTITLQIVGLDVVVRDTTAPVVAGEGCRPISAHEAGCTITVPVGQSGVYVVAEAFGGDDDDRLTAVGSTLRGLDTLRVDGGPGDDRVHGRTSAKTTVQLAGGSGDDRLTGGPGSEGLGGGSGDDLLRGGGGDDGLTGDTARTNGNDLLDGGPGADWAQWDGASDVRVDLSDPRSDGRAGERDRLRSIENVQTGDGDDAIIGDDGPNFLVSGIGRDLVAGRDGDDTLRASGNDARILAGPGNDDIAPLEAHVRCGSGSDRIAGPAGFDPAPTLRRDHRCEWYADGAFDIAPLLRVVGHDILLTIRSRTTHRARASVDIVDGLVGRSITRSFVIAPLRRTTVRIPLGRAEPRPGRRPRTLGIVTFGVLQFEGAIEIDWSRAAASR